MGLTEIVFNLVDNVSSTMADMASNAESSLTDVESAAETASTGLDSMSDSAQNLSYTMESADGTKIEMVASAADNAASSLDDASSSAGDVSNSLDGIDSGALEAADNAAESLSDDLGNVSNKADEAADSADNISGSMDSASQSTEGVGIAAGLAGLGIGAAVSTAVNAAGNVEDSWLRIGAVFGQTSEEAQTYWSNAISNMTSVTGRGAGAAREYIAQMGNAGITNKDILVQGFQDVSGAAFITGNSIESVSMAYQRVVMTGNLGSRQLMQLGLNSQDVYAATGLSVDQVSEKLKGLSQEERAQMLNSIMNSKDGITANNMYKQSWQNVTDSLERAYGYVSRIFGSLILPLVVPAMNLLTSLLNTVASGVNKLNGPIGGTIKLFLGLGVGIAAVLAFMLMAAAAWNLLGVAAAATSVKMILMNGVMAAQKVAMVASIIATDGLAGAMALLQGTTVAGIGEAAAFAGVTELGTAAQSQGVIATMASVASRVAQTVASGAAAVATGVLTAATWLFNAALAANPITWVIIAIVALIVILAYLYNKNETVRNAINALWSGLQALGSYIMGGLMAAWNGLLVILSPITDALGRLWAAISNKGAENSSKTFEQISGVLHSLWTIIQTVATGVMNVLTPVWNALLPVLTAVANVISGGLGASFRTIFGIIGAVVGFIATFIDILADLISGNITFGQAMQMMWSNMQELVLEILSSIILGIGGFILSMGQKAGEAGISFVTNLVNWIVTLPPKIAYWLGFVIGRILLWNIQLRNYAIQAGRNFVTSLVQFIQTLPSRVWSFLLLASTRIILFKNLAVAYAQQTGRQFVANLISFIQTLPSRAWAFLLNTLSRITSFGSQAGSNARQAGTNVVNGLKNSITSLPQVMWDELMRVGQKITDAGGQLYNYAMDLGKNIVDGLKKGAGIASPGDMYKAIKKELDIISEEMDKSKEDLGTKASDIGTSITDGFDSKLKQPTIPTATQTIAQPSAVTASSAGVNLDIPGLQAQTAAAKTLVTTNVTTVTGQYNLLKTNTGNSWKSMVDTQKNSLNTMKTTMASTLKSVVDNNTASYQRLQNTTQSTLTNLKTQTNSSMTNVKTSWNGMRDSLVSAASKIQTNVNSDINKLSTNIGSFYSKIQNPALFLAGPGPVNTRTVGRIPNVSRGLFAGPSNGNQELRMLDMAIPMPCNDPNGCFAGWSDFRPNEPDIMSKVNTYVPNFSPYGSLNTTVGDFENSSMPIMGNFGAFKSIAENMIGKTAYQYYFNSKGGSPYDVYQSGGFNCWDGALIMLSLANAFGLSGYMGQGTWNGIGHAWAVIEGQNMDTTAYQHGYGWTSPKVQGYAGSPKNLGEMNPNYGNGSSDSLIIEGKLEHEFNINLSGIPENMDPEEVKTIIREFVNSPAFLREFTGNNFMDLVTQRLKERANAKRKQYGVPQ